MVIPRAGMSSVICRFLQSLSGKQVDLEMGRIPFWAQPCGGLRRFQSGAESLVSR
jgi:hypothetical protein